MNKNRNLLSFLIGFVALTCLNLTSCDIFKPFNIDLTGYFANIGNALAIGIDKASTSEVLLNNTSTNNQQKVYKQSPKAAQSSERDYLVVSTKEDYSNLRAVTFSKIVTENISNETTGTKYVIASDESISIPATKGFEYSVFLDNELIYNNIQDNDTNDKNSKIGVITLDNLVSGNEYRVQYRGIGTEITLTQDEIGGEIEKVHVTNGYTFISFVPKGKSRRHEAGDILTTHHTITYDQRGYYSDANRQSFIIDNKTGYIYKIENFVITSIIKGCLFIAENTDGCIWDDVCVGSDDKIIYDFKINENDELEIFPLYTNDRIDWYLCHKDKYGNKFIANNNFDMYDEKTNTYFYKSSRYGRSDTDYILTSNNETIKLVYSQAYSEMYQGPSRVIDASIILEGNKERKLSREDTFTLDDYRHIPDAAYKVENGVVFSYKGSVFSKYDGIKNENTYLEINHGVIDLFLREYDVLLEYYNNKLLCYYNFWESYDLAEKEINFTYDLKDNPAFSYEVILENCSQDGDRYYLLEELSGYTRYEIVVEIIDGKPVVKYYVEGTYYQPQTVITLQPLNK